MVAAAIQAFMVARRSGPTARAPAGRPGPFSVVRVRRTCSRSPRVKEPACPRSAGRPTLPRSWRGVAAQVRDRELIQARRGRPTQKARRPAWSAQRVVDSGRPSREAAGRAVELAGLDLAPGAGWPGHRLPRVDGVVGAQQSSPYAGMRRRRPGRSSCRHGRAPSTWRICTARLVDQQRLISDLADPRRQRDLVARQTLRSALAVPALELLGDRVRDPLCEPESLGERRPPRRRTRKCRAPGGGRPPPPGQASKDGAVHCRGRFRRQRQHLSAVPEIAGSAARRTRARRRRTS